MSAASIFLGHSSGWSVWGASHWPNAQCAGCFPGWQGVRRENGTREGVAGKMGAVNVDCEERKLPRLRTAANTAHQGPVSVSWRTKWQLLRL